MIVFQQNNNDGVINSVVKEPSKYDLLEPRDSRSEVKDCECEYQTINHHSKVDEPLPAADIDVVTKNHNSREKRVVESS
jgi:hypothetical protein